MIMPTTGSLQMTINLSPSPELLEVLRMLLCRATMQATNGPLQQSFTFADQNDQDDAESQIGPISPIRPIAAAPVAAPAAEPPRTLMRAYEELVLPRKIGTSKQQQSTHRTALKKFAVFLEAKYRCIEPILRLDGSQNVLPEFAAWLINEQDSSPVTAGHKITHLKMVADAMKEAGWIRKAPFCPTPEQLNATQRSEARPTRKVARSVSFADAEALLAHCHAATYPALGDVTPCEFWQSMILWHALWGPRTQDIYAYLDSSKTGLQWSDVFFSPECPDAELSQALPDLRSEFGWLYYPVGKDRKSDCPFVLLPMTQWMHALLTRLRGVIDPAGQNRVIPVSRSRDQFRKAWSAIRTAAGVSETIFLSQGTGGATAFRKTAAKWWKRQTGSLEVSQYILHHAEVTTAEVNYLDTMETVIPLLLKHLPEFPIKLPTAVTAS